ncbi:hypothetical protein [Pluralibacter gergoviae]|uniref:hypothetical protein n=1 Tax=Pluralibacter gergoviae TaxID=61647 RepID=UPI0012D459E3|nr:hypothetical protein [Pluralibacter gergoviae]
MKTQMQIVQEAIARLEAMSRDEFRATLIAAGAVECDLLFSKDITGFGPVERASRDEHSFTVCRNKAGLTPALSLVF